MKYRRSVALKVRCLKSNSRFRSRGSWFRMNSYGASSMNFISSLDFRMIVVLLPQEKTAANSPAISTSCFLLNRCGTEMGSAGINEGSLYTSTFFSRKFLSSFLFFNLNKLTDCQIQIFDQIVGVFNTYTDANEGIT